MSESMQHAYAALGNLPISQWLGAFTPAVVANPNRSGAHYLPELQQPSGYYPDQAAYGGFFAPVTPENLSDTLATLFADSPDRGQWFADYLSSGSIPSTDAQRLFVQRYDQLMIGMLDASLPPTMNSPTASASLRSFDFVTLANDETLTDSEFYRMIDKLGMQADLARMGDPLAMQWVLLSGGIVQGVIDFQPIEPQPTPDTTPPVSEQAQRFSDALRNDALFSTASIPRRYSPHEFDRLISPVAQAALILQNRGTLAGYTDGYPMRLVENFDEALPSAVRNMESICTSPTDSLRFSPSDTPVYRPDAALER